VSAHRLAFRGALLLGIGLLAAAGWVERGTTRERGRRLEAREEQRRSADRFLASWERAAREPPVTQDLGRGELNAVALSPDARRVASVSSNDRVRLHDARTGELLHEWRAHRRGITRVAWSPDGTRLVSAGPDRTIRVWTLDPPTEQWVLRGHESPVASFAWQPDGVHLVSVTLHAQVKIWDLSTGAETTSRDGPRSGILYATVTPRADAILWAAPGGLLRVWDAATGSKLGGLREIGVGRVSSLEVDPSRELLATAARDVEGNLHLFDLALERERAAPRPAGRVTALCVSADARHVISATDLGLVQMWSAQGGEELLRLQGAVGAIEDLAFDAEAGVLVAAGPGALLQIWHARPAEGLGP